MTRKPLTISIHVLDPDPMDLSGCDPLHCPLSHHDDDGGVTRPLTTFKLTIGEGGQTFRWLSLAVAR